MNHKMTSERRFILAIRSAAANIFVPEARRIAARDAKLIPKVFVERMPNTIKGRIAASARQTMRELEDTTDTQALREMAQALRAYAGILEPGATIVIDDTANRRSGKKRARA